MSNKSTEDYLKTIYSLSKSDRKVTTTSIADGLQISPASVTDMIKKLFENDYLAYIPYRGVKLTRKGEKSALRVIRRHRLLELFLVRVLGYPLEKVHEEAERLEHVISDELEAHIDEYLDYPKLDPHGDPIPSASGEVEEIPYLRLSDLHPGDTAIVMRITDSRKLLQLMKKIDLTLNHTVLVQDKEEFDESLRILINKKREHFLSHEVCKNIFVKKVG